MLYSIDDDSDQCTEESPRVLAFFDHLIQHEKEDEEDEDNEVWGKNWKQSSCTAFLAVWSFATVQVACLFACHHPDLQLSSLYLRDKVTCAPKNTTVMTTV